MKCLLIDPVEQSIKAVEVRSGDIATALGCQWIDRVGLTLREDLWIDDEGRYQYPNPLGYFELGGQVFCGRGLVIGHDGQGESVSTRMEPFQLAPHVRFLATPPLEDVEPSITIIEIGGAE